MTMHGRKLLIALLAIVAGLYALGLHNARADPVVRRMTIKLPRWPAGAAPVTVALLSDIHFGSATMDADRLARIVGQVDRLRPDLVLIAGDFVAGHDRGKGAAAAAALAVPLRRLHAPLGVLAVRGNHDNWGRDAAVAAALGRAGVTVLHNEAVKRGPLAIGGLADQTRGRDLPATLRRLAPLPGARILLAHEPGIAAKVPAAGVLVLAGHTHCEQIVLPLVGAIQPMTSEGRYRCGAIRERGRLTIVTAGLGTSVVPLRFGAPPDLWLLTLTG